ncbi:hypothetical protein SAMN05444007_101198 [Cribrihabitans marinus]|uniref:Antifreeze glycopeptide polyprotein n=1 Tax=Cribrihabitans marinus TaxID=1227549 RepID=A0A1H6QKF1_9RHOB|nr:hypothetical protein [Cribrihabitans marinus]GGH19198.1 hypothetical protein GCM10010973_02450 [Cribrihabitans marinus]SEI44218.1 hypothetical protein SAMN05444007_101198 [Cribrihabitans marinus]
MRIKQAVFPLLLPMGAVAQQPLSAIDWLNQPPPVELPGTVLLEPPVTPSALRPEVEVTPLESLSVPVGLVGTDVTGLPADLWRGSDVARIEELLDTVAVRDVPAMQSLLYTLLLSESGAPSGTGAGERLLLARIDRLMDLGAVDAAQELAQVAGPTASPDRFARWFDATLLTGDEDRSCKALAAEPHLSRDYAARIFCAARLGDWQSAALTLEAAHALDILPSHKLDLLDRFLSPEIYDGAPPLPRPDAPDPLAFRLHESIGERLNTATLPQPFAVADLRDIAGWKAQVEAAERLARTGALTPNHLLGLYTARQPAASGGVWDRVQAVQRFETALQTGSPEALGKTLPDAWAAMTDARLEVPFAELFAEALAKSDAGGLAWRIRLLSRDYEAAAATPPDQSAETQFLAAIAQGEPGRATPPDATARAITAGFDPEATPPAEISRIIRRGQLGEAILRAMALLASGDPGDLSDALATFRAVGLEDTARRAGLQLMLLDRG